MYVPSQPSVALNMSCTVGDSCKPVFQKWGGEFFYVLHFIMAFI